MAMAYNEKLPLTMGNRVIGVISFDEDGKIEGQLIGTELLGLLNEFFGEGLLDIAFHGKPGKVSPNTVSELNAKLRKYLRNED
jgi:hypothetical protein